MANRNLPRAVGSLWEGLALGATAFLFAWTAYHVLLLARGFLLPRPGPFDPSALRNPVDLPALTILIPAKQASPVVEDAVRQAIRLRYARERKQILVVEDGSTDGTREIIERCVIEHQEVEFIKRPATLGKPAALNAAMPFIRGEIVLFMDVDSRVSGDFLLRAAKFFHDHPEFDAAQAILRAMEDDWSVVSALDRYETHFAYTGVIRARDRLGLFVPLGGTGMFIKTAALREIGPWDEGCLAEDLEYAMRLWKGGKKVGVIPADVYIQSPNTIRNFVRQRRRWWGGAIQILSRGVFVGGSKVGLRRRFDMALVASAPLVVVLGNAMLIATLAAHALGSQLLSGMFYLAIGVLGSHLFLIGAAVASTIRRREWRLLKLIPGIYIDWVLQVGIVLSLLVDFARRKKIPWETTDKRKISWSADRASGRRDPGSPGNGT